MTTTEPEKKKRGPQPGHKHTLGLTAEIAEEMTIKERVEARAKCNEATPGPWASLCFSDSFDNAVIRVANDAGEPCSAPPICFPPEAPDGDRWKEDSEFIAAARTSLPAALKEIDRLEEIIHKMKATEPEEPYRHPKGALPRPEQAQSPG